MHHMFLGANSSTAHLDQNNPYHIPILELLASYKEVYPAAKLIGVVDLVEKKKKEGVTFDGGMWQDSELWHTNRGHHSVRS